MNNQIKSVRTRLKMTQQELATASGIARQTIGGIEAGTYAVSLAVGLKIAKTLGCPIDELFWLDEDTPCIQAKAVSKIPVETLPVRIALTRVSGNWIAYPLKGDDAFRTEMLPSDGLAQWSYDGGENISVKIHDDLRALSETVSIAGCAPTLPLWARSAERWHPGLRTFCVQANSTDALNRLARGEVHAAGVHMHSDKSNGGNIAAVKKALGDKESVLVNLGIWEEGFVVRRDNPKSIKGIEDIPRPDITLVNRETGAGSRLLLDNLIKDCGASVQEINGYEQCVFNHRDVALAVRDGRADIGIAIGSIAETYGLDFIPIHSVQYDLVFLKEHLDYEPVQKLLSTLNHRWIKTQLRATGGFDTTLTGDIVG